MTGEPLLPPIDAEAEPFWEGTRRGELRVQQCVETSRLIFPPRATSPWAPHAKPIWTTVSGRGRIWSFVVPHPPLLAPFADLARYNVIVVALDEDPTIRLIGNLVARDGGAIDEVDASSIEIGAAVRVTFDPVSKEFSLPRWVIAAEAASKS